MPHERAHHQKTLQARRLVAAHRLFCLQLLIIAVILHRSATIGSIEFTNLLSITIAGALTALVMAAVSLAKIWRQGALGAGTATAGIFVAMLVLGVPLWHLPSLLFKPKINDIVTDPKTPPRFAALLGKRPAGANAYIYPGAAFAEWQLRDYPDIRPMMLERSREATFDLVRDAVKVLGWEVVADEPPSEMAPGRIEAVARTPVVAYADDVVIVVSRMRNESRIDVRSASRFGDHDLGANARRIRRLFANVKTGLAEGEKSALELALARRARDARYAREKKEKQERAKEAQRRRQVRAARRAPPPIPVPPNIQDEPEPTEPPRRRVRPRDFYKFWEQFGE